MATNTSATVREDTPHTISNSLRRHAQSVLDTGSIDPDWGPLIRYALEINDPCLADILRRAEAGEKIIDAIDFSNTLEPIEQDPDEKKIEALAKIICGAGDESAAALFVLMGTLEHSNHPKLIANVAKHSAFSCCGESNLYGMVDAQLAVVEGGLLTPGA